MKSLTAAILSVMFVLALAGVAAAQSTSPAPRSTPSTPQTSPSPAPPSPSTNIDNSKSDTTVNAPGPSSSKPDVNVDVKSERRDDGGAASPRTGGESTRIFGLSPTAAALVGAAILVIVILAIASMGWSGSRNDTHIDVDRRV